MNYLITYAILVAVAALICRAQRRRFERQFLRDHQAGTEGGGRDKLGALIEATRELPHESYAWGAASRERIATPDDEPVPYLPASPWDFWENDIAGGGER